jgi:hypothetical protein
MRLPLTAFENSVYSQFGEDGVINHLLTALREAEVALSFRSCELGAWDGKHLSNTMNLILNQNFQGVLIEADPIKFADLQTNSAELQIVALNEFVEPDGNTLEEIFQRNRIPIDLDVLSIDIDGSDYQILQSLNDMRPKIIVIEYNPSIPLDFVYINPVGLSRGSSALAIVNLAKEKGYSLVHRTSVNLILILNEHLEKQNLAVEISVTAPLEVDLEIPRVFFGYDGTVLLTTKSLQLPWHDIQIKESALQTLPAKLRKIPTQYDRVESLLYFVRVFGWINFVKRLTLRILHRV